MDAERTCATCAAFNPAPKFGEPTCWNMVFFGQGRPQDSGRSPVSGDRCGRHLTVQEAEIDEKLSLAGPVFLSAMHRYMRALEEHGPDATVTARAMVHALSIAPLSLADDITHMAIQLGVLPDLLGFTDGGRPVFGFERMAKKLGCSQAMAEQLFLEMEEERAELEQTHAAFHKSASLLH